MLLYIRKKEMPEKAIPTMQDIYSRMFSALIIANIDSNKINIGTTTIPQFFMIQQHTHTQQRFVRLYTRHLQLQLHQLLRSQEATPQGCQFQRFLLHNSPSQTSITIYLFHLFKTQCFHNLAYYFTDILPVG